MFPGGVGRASSPQRLTTEMVVLTSWLFLACLLAFTTVVVRAADPMPTAGPGATKADVINVHGKPTRLSKFGDREILTYPVGQFTLSHGRVERVEISAAVKPAIAKPAPATKPKLGAPRPEDPVDPWMVNLADATRAAAPRNARILALFTGSDWSPAGRMFHDEVALDPEFLNT